MMSDSKRPSNEKIASRAYTYWERDGRIAGRDMEYWLRAETDLPGERRNGRSGNGSSASPPEKGNGASAPRGRRLTTQPQAN